MVKSLDLLNPIFLCRYFFLLYLNMLNTNNDLINNVLFIAILTENKKMDKIFAKHLNY